jgi:hypothetical protein
MAARLGAFGDHVGVASEDLFTVAEGLGRGLTPKQLRGRTLDRSVWGVRRASSGPATIDDRCGMVALRMPPHAVFSHTTAALLLGAPLPLELEHAPHAHVAYPAGGRAPHARGIRGHELDLRAGDIVSTRGIAHTSPARTWCDLATALQLLDLVAVGDFLIHWRSPLVHIEELAAAAHRFAGRRGIRRIRDALPLLNDRAESRPESRLRAILAIADLPPVRVNHVIIDSETGPAVRTDVAFVGFAVVLEYQGDYHRDRAQWRKDMTRRTRLEALGWYVMELNADDLANPAELVERIRALLVGRELRG